MSILPDFKDQLPDAHEQHYGAGRRSRRIARIAMRAVVAAVLAGAVVGVILVASGGPTAETETAAAPSGTPAPQDPVEGRIVFVNATANSMDNLAADAEKQARVAGELRNQSVAQQDSEVLYRAGFRDDADTLARRLKIERVVLANPPAEGPSMYADALRDADVAVVLGLDRAPAAGPLPTPSAPPGNLLPAEYQQIGQLPLHATDGGTAIGQFLLFATRDTPPSLAFQLVGENLPESRSGEAYAVWLVGGGDPRFLGYAPAVGPDGRLGVSGPRHGDETALSAWLSTADRLVLTIGPEQQQTPGKIVLEAKLG